MTCLPCADAGRECACFPAPSLAEPEVSAAIAILDEDIGRLGSGRTREAWTVAKRKLRLLLTMEEQRGRASSQEEAR